MTKKLTRTEKTNQLALRAREEGYVTEELWEAVKGLAYSHLNRKYKVPFDDVEQIGFIAATRTLGGWVPEKGDFCLSYAYLLRSESQQYWFKNTAAVSITGHAYRIDAVPVMVHPDAVTESDSGEDATGADCIYGSIEPDNHLEDDVNRMLNAPSLSKREKQIIERYYAGLNLREVAVDLGISESAVSTTFSRIKTKLKKYKHLVEGLQ